MPDNKPMTIFRTFTDTERAALKLHGLDTKGPSQLSDAFVLGMRHVANPPEGHTLVMVPKLQPADEPNWEECIRQAEVATGLKVERHTLSIVIREVRRWLAGRTAGQRQVPDA